MGIFSRRGDAGTAFMTVMATTTILFVLATTLMLMIAYQTQTTQIRTARLRATHIADAGVNAYLYQLKNNYGYYNDTPDTGWIDLGGGERYRVVATAATRTTPLTLRSTGVSMDGTVTIAATVRFPSFADYMFLSNASLEVNGDARINGSIRSNGNIDNQGEISGQTIASGIVTGNGKFGAGYEEGRSIVDFNQVLVVMDEMRTAALDDGTYYANTGSYGYRVTVTGTTAYVEKILSGTDTGDMVTAPIGLVTIPSNGVLYFADDVWVSGSYSTALTIVSEGDLYLIGSYQPTDPNSIATSGLVAKKNIIVPAWYKSVKDDMYINAALLSATGRIYADIKQGVIRERITITGAVTAFDSGGVWGTYDFTGQPIAGFRQNVYTYDQRLIDNPPPLYPQVFDGSLKVDTWVEDRNQTFTD